MTERKLTIRQEKFCREYFKTGNATEAYRRSYNCKNSSQTTITTHASHLLKVAHIMTMMAQLKAEAQKDCLITIASQTNKLERILNKAEAKEDFSPAISAVMGQAKLHGLLVEKGLLDIDVNAKVKIQSSEHILAKKVAFMLAKAAAENKE